VITTTPRIAAALVLTLALLRPAWAAGPWTWLHDPQSGTTLLLVGTTHKPRFLPFAMHARLIAAVGRSDVLWFESITGTLGSDRGAEYSAVEGRFLRESDLAGFARWCATAMRMSSPRSSWPTMESAPVVLYAFRHGMSPARPGPNVVDASEVALFDASTTRFPWLVPRELESAQDMVDFAAGIDAAQVNATIEAACRAASGTGTREQDEAYSAAFDEPWRAGDWDAIADLERRSSMDVHGMPPAVHDRLLDWRNERMLAKALNGSGGARRITLVVGAAHLGGPHGLVALAKGRGFVSEP